MTSDNRTWRLYLLLALGLGLILRLWISFQPVAVLIEKVLVDDAFYYLQLAKQLAAGHGPTFDGKYLTNGFHPLWLLVLAPLFYIFPHSLTLPIHTSLILLAIFNVATGYMIYLTVQWLTGDRGLSLVAGGWWLFNPLVMFTALDGVEVALSIWAISLVGYYYIRLRAKDPIKLYTYFTLGLGIGLTLLARSDAIFLWLAVTLDIMLVYYYRKQIGKGIRAGLALGMGCLLMNTAWLLWNWFTFGSVRQISGRVIPYIQHAFYFAQHGHSFPRLIKHILGLMIRGIATVSYMTGVGDLLLMPLAWPILVCALVLFILLMFRHWAALKEGFRPTKPLNFLLVFSGLLFSYYTVYHWYINFRYLLPVLYVLNLYLVTGLGSWLKLIGIRRGRITIGLCSVLVIFSFSAICFWAHGRAPHQRQHYQAVNYLNHHLPQATIASWNAGILGYFYNGCTINLDGVVNNPLYPFLQQRKIADFVQQEQVDYLCDSELTFQEWPLFWGEGGYQEMELIHQIPPPQETIELKHWPKWTKKRMSSPFLIYKLR